MTVNVLGTEYKIIEQSEQDNPKMKGNNGLCDRYAKTITLDFSDEYDIDNTSNYADYKKHVLRHELIHAFLHESGVYKYCEDEALVDLIAVQMPKMVKAMNETGCL